MTDDQSPPHHDPVPEHGRTSDQERVVVVTGASRGVGRGIALALARPGTTVHITGRTAHSDQGAPIPGSLAETVAEIEKRGARGVASVVDHRDDAAVADFFAGIDREHGRLDICVNNAFAIPAGLTDEGPFWEKPLGLVDMLEVGLRSSYVSAWNAAPLLVKAPRGLLVSTSSFGARCYMHGPAYGAVKAGVDKMAHDMAIDFARVSEVCCFSLWLGLVRTERTMRTFEANPDAYKDVVSGTESNEFGGRVIDAIFDLEDRSEYAGRVVVGAEAAPGLGVLDVDGKQPPSHRTFLGDPTTFNPAEIG